MKSAYSALVQSRFFNPAFNSAIFDGPIRLYFAQAHEAMALKVYFCLQQKYPEILAQAKEYSRRSGINLLVMMYPNGEAFAEVFENHKGGICVQDSLHQDSLVGVCGPIEDKQIDEILVAIVSAFKAWDTRKSEVTASL